MIRDIIRIGLSKILRFSAGVVILSSIFPLVNVMHWYGNSNTLNSFRSSYTVEGLIVVSLLALYAIYVLFTKKPKAPDITAAGYGAFWVIFVVPFMALSIHSPAEGFGEYILRNYDVVQDKGFMASVVTALIIGMAYFADFTGYISGAAFGFEGLTELSPYFAFPYILVIGSMPTLGYYWAHRLAGNHVRKATPQEMSAGRRALREASQPSSVRFVDRK